MAETGMRLKVNTDTLISASAQVEGKIRKASAAFAQIEETVKGSRTYWDSDGNSQYLKAYNSKKEEINLALNRFKEHIADLRTIAGVYAEAENAATERNNELNTDVII